MKWTPSRTLCVLINPTEAATCDTSSAEPLEELQCSLADGIQEKEVLNLSKDSFESGVLPPSLHLTKGFRPCPYRCTRKRWPVSKMLVEGLIPPEFRSEQRIDLTRTVKGNWKNSEHFSALLISTTNKLWLIVSLLLNYSCEFHFLLKTLEVFYKL